MSRPAEDGFYSPDGIYREPPLLYSSCSGHTWVEARAPLDLRDGQELVVRARLGEQRFDFTAAEARLISRTPAELNAVLVKTSPSDVLRIKVPYKEYGLPDVSFQLKGYASARTALFKACGEP